VVRLFRSSKSDLKRALVLIDAGKRAEAFPLLARAAKSGLAEAEYQIARSYLEGAGVPPSAAEGARWLERSAHQGFAPAQSLLAAFCIQGVSPSGSDGGDGLGGSLAASLFSAAPTAPKPDHEKAAFWARKAADAGNADAQALLGYLLTSGPEPMRDPDQAETLYRRSAEAKCPQGQLGYGLALLRRAKEPQDYIEPAAHLAAAAEANLGTAEYLLGMLTEQGQGVERDQLAAVDLYRRAAERGVRTAQLLA